ncbi:MAG TPA: hypothetical protein VFU98_00975, partial [Microlunatus sp.]|nr:hypothetical protein [Microlunatus sp.]
MTVARDSHHESTWALSPTKIMTHRGQGTRESRRHYPWGPLSPLLRDGVRPLFVMGDAFACLVTATILNAGGQSTVGVTLVMVVLLAAGGLNRSRLALSVLDDLPQIVRLWLVGAALLVVVSEVATGNMQLVLLFGVLPAIVGCRVVLYAIVRHWRTRGSITHPTVVVGAGSLGQIVVDALARHPESGLRAVGFVDSSPLDLQELPVPMLGEPAELTEVLVDSRARALIVAHGGITDAALVALVRKCQR